MLDTACGDLEEGWVDGRMDGWMDGHVMAAREGCACFSSSL